MNVSGIRICVQDEHDAVNCTPVAATFWIVVFYKTREMWNKTIDGRSSSYCKSHAFTGWKQQPVNGGAHTEQAVQDDAKQE